jgi:hypothetical protein
MPGPEEVSGPHRTLSTEGVPTKFSPSGRTLSSSPTRIFTTLCRRSQKLDLARPRLGSSKVLVRPQHFEQSRFGWCLDTSGEMSIEPRSDHP